METINIELTAVERNKLATILHQRYSESINLFELSAIKSILTKLGEKVEDWTPPLN